MKKALIFLAIGVSMLIIGAVVFIMALSAPTVSGPAFMRIIWDIWMLVGIFLIGVSAGIAVFRIFGKK